MASEVIDLSGRMSPWSSTSRRMLRSHFALASRDDDVWQTPAHAGDPRLCASLADLLGDDAENIVVTSGVRAAACVLARPGETVVHERPTFQGTVTALESAGARVQLAEWECLPALCSRPAPPTMIWVTAPGRNPDGATIPTAMITELSELARRGVTVIVNETYRWYSAATVRIPGAIYVGSFSKIAAGGVRIGWIRGAGIRSRVLPRHHALPPAIWQRTWTYFLQSGGWPLLLEEVVAKAAASRACFLDRTGLEIEPVTAPSGPSFFYYVRAIDEETAVARCSGQGLIVGPGRDFLSTRPGLRLCFFSVDIARAELAAKRFVGLLAAGL